MRRVVLILAGLAVAGLAVFWVVTAPKTTDAAEIAGIEPDLARGEQVFWAAGCSSCHAAPEAEGDAKLVLSGGQRFVTEFGTFIAPNITPHAEAGIGGWSDLDLVNALRNGVSPAGQHYFPALPYTAYAKAELSDLVSLAAYLRTLPEDATPSQPHEVGFPFNIRRTIGGWKLLYAGGGWAVDGDLSPEAERGRYLAEALAHCGECHTPRNALGGLETGRWFAGAANPSGEGRIPGIAPGVLDWSETDIAYYLETGFTPDFDSAGGKMASVVEHMAKLTPEDRAAIAAYVKAVPAVE